MSSPAQSASLVGYRLSPPVGAYRPLALDTTAGLIEGRVYEAAPARGAILWLGPARAGFAEPAPGFYDQLAERFQALGVASLRLAYRHPEDAVQRGLDALVGAFWLGREAGHARLAVVGAGAGAAGAVWAGRRFERVSGVAALSPDADALAGWEALAPKARLLLSPAPRCGEEACAAPPAEAEWSGETVALSEELSDWLKGCFGFASGDGALFPGP